MTSKREFMALTDWDLVNVIFRPNVHHDNPEQGYWPVSRSDPKDPPVKELTFKEAYFQTWRERDMPEEEIQAKWEAKHGST